MKRKNEKDYKTYSKIPEKLRQEIWNTSKGSYQNSVLKESSWSGSELKGSARDYVGHYADSRKNLFNRIQKIAKIYNFKVYFIFLKPYGQKALVLKNLRNNSQYIW